MGQDKYHQGRPLVLVGGSGACKVTMHAKCIHSPIQYNQAKEKSQRQRSEEKNFGVELVKMDTRKGSRSNPDADDKKKMLLHGFVFEVSICCLPWVCVLYSLMCVTLFAQDLSRSTFYVALRRQPGGTFQRLRFVFPRTSTI